MRAGAPAQGVGDTSSSDVTGGDTTISATLAGSVFLQSRWLKPNPGFSRVGNRYISGNPEVRGRDRSGVELTQRSRRPGSGNRHQSSVQEPPAAWEEPGGNRRRLSEAATAGEQARAGQGPQ